MATEFFTIESLLTFGGCAMATGLATQMLKKIKWLVNINVQFISFIVALFILIAGQAVTGGFSFAGLYLNLFNAVAVALSSNGGYDLVSNFLKKAEEKDYERTLAELEAMEEAEHTSEGGV